MASIALVAERARRRVHVINPLWDATGGSEWRSIELYRLLSTHCQARLWSCATPAPALAAAYPILQLGQGDGQHPKAGTLVFVGDYHDPGPWLQRCHPDRSLLVYNTDSPDRLSRMLDRISLQGRRSVELVYASKMLTDRCCLPGRVERSSVDISRFAPTARPDRPYTAPT